MKKLILFILLLPALCFGDMNPYIAGQTVASGGSSNVLLKILGSEVDTDSPATGSGSLTVTGVTHDTDHNSVSDGAFTSFGSGDELSIQSTDNLNSTKGSVSFWIKQNGYNQLYQHYFMYDDGDDGNNDDILKFYCNASTTSSAFEFNNVGYQISHTNILNNSWHHVAITWDTATDELKMFVDNVQQGSTISFTTAPPTLSASTIYFGNSAVGDRGAGNALIDTIYITDDTDYKGYSD